MRTPKARFIRKSGKLLITVVVLMTVLIGSSCTTNGYNTQGGAVIGAGLGALAGQAIGRNTAGTLIGAASGALAGAIVGNAIDQDQMNRRLYARDGGGRACYSAPVSPQDQPPGRWVEVPAQWMGGKWVPAHRAWVPVNPDSYAGR
jgi:phage tail tape-measure protein